MRLGIALSVTWCVACGFGDNTGHGTDANSGQADARVDSLGPADAASDAEQPATGCSMLPQSGCTGSFPACDLTPEEDGNTVCRAVTALGTSDSRCNELTACSAGYTCVGDLGVDAACMKFCAVDGDCSGTGSRCAFALQNDSGASLNINVCSNACDISAQTGCPSGMGCIGSDRAGGDITDCRVMGDNTNGQFCSTTLDCVPGSVCVDDGQTRCHSYCKVGVSGQCPGSWCSGFSSPLVIGSTTYGFCE